MPRDLRHFKQIVSTLTSYFTGHSALTDLNPGSVARTLAEGFSLELAEAYVQVQNLLNLFSIDKATGDDLDERGLDFAITRQQPTKAAGVVTISDQNLSSYATVVTTLTTAAAAGTTTLAVVSTSGFGTTGTLIVDRGNAGRESVDYTVAGPTSLTLDSALVNDHVSGATVQLPTVGSDRIISAGTAVLTTGPSPLRFVTTADATLLDGDVSVTGVPIQSTGTGSAFNVIPGTIGLFESPPFPTAQVTNPSILQGGRDLESDESYRARIKDSQQSLSSATASRIENEALKVSVAATGQQVVSAKIVEPVSPGVSILYISDGTASFAASQQNVSLTEVLVAVAKTGQTRAALNYWPIVQGTENLYVSLERGTASSTAVGSLTDGTKSWSNNQFAGFLLKDVAGAFFTVTGNTSTVLSLSGASAPAQGPYALFNPATTAYPAGSKLTANTHYAINDTNGQIQLTHTAFPAGLVANDSIIAYAPNPSTAAYIRYTGLVQEVQRVINGDPTDLTDYPGVKAAGTQVLVEVPTLVDVPVHGVIVAEPGVDEASVRLPVRQAVVAYVNSLGIGDNVLTSRIIEAAVAVPGVFDFQLQQPLVNVVVSDDQLAKIALTDVTVN